MGPAPRGRQPAAWPGQPRPSARRHRSPPPPVSASRTLVRPPADQTHATLLAHRRDTRVMMRGTPPVLAAWCAGASSRSLIQPRGVPPSRAGAHAPLYRGRHRARGLRAALVTASPYGPSPPAVPPDVFAGPDDPQRARRLEWSRLMHRAYAVDVLVCPKCAGPMRLVALIEDERVAEKILRHLGMPTRAPPRAPPRRRAAASRPRLPRRGRLRRPDLRRRLTRHPRARAPAEAATGNLCPGHGST